MRPIFCLRNSGDPYPTTKMGPDFVVIRRVSLEDAAQVRLAKNGDRPRRACPPWVWVGRLPECEKVRYTGTTPSRGRRLLRTS